MPSNDRRRSLRDEIRAAVPEGPGVYTWFGAGGEPVYIGESRNLRRRMLSYLGPAQTAAEARTRQLAYSIEAFAWQATRGELMALVLEDALIKQLNPRHNERQRDYRERRYLLLTDDGFPTCLIVEGAAPRAGTLYGPFKDEYFVANLIDFLRDSFGLRACIDPEPFRRSPRFDLGTCPGPCRAAISADDYALRAERARHFLTGDSSWVSPKLSAEMEQASAQLRFEEAASLRERLAFSLRFSQRQQFITEFRAGSVLVPEPRFRLTYRFHEGRLVELLDESADAVPVPVGLDAPLADPRFVLDRANVVYGWLRRNRVSARAPS